MTFLHCLIAAITAIVIYKILEKCRDVRDKE